MDRTLVRVLLVEDNPADALLLQESLSGDLLTEFQVTVVERLGQGLDELDSRPYDVVLLDLGLPDSQGLDTFEAAHAGFPDIPMIVLSGASDEWLALQAVKSGAQDYLVKGEADWHFGARSIRYAIERHQSQLAMRASEARFSTIFQSSPISIAITRLADNRLLEVNEAWERITGYSRGEVIGKYLPSFDLWIHPEERQNTVEILRRDGRVTGFEFQMRRRDGRVADLLLSAELIELGGEACMLSMAQDITGRKRAEEEMKQSQAFSKTIIDSIPGTFYMIDANGRYVGWNAYQRDEIVGQPENLMGDAYAIDTIYPDDRPIIGEKIANVLKNGTEEVVEGRVLLRGGPTFQWLLMTGTRMMMKDSPVLVGIGIDITERKQVEAALRLSEERHRLISSMISDYVYSGVAYPGGRATTEWISGAFEQITGYTVEGLASLPLGFASLLLPEDLEKVASQHQLLLENGSLTIEYRIRRKDGEIRWLLDRMSAVADGTETHAVRIIGGVEDITERKQADQALRESQAELRAVYEHAPVMMCLLGPGRQVLYANQAFTAFTGISEAELMQGRACGVFGCINAYEHTDGCGFGVSCRDCRLRLAIEDTLATGQGHRDVEYSATLERDGVRRDVYLLGATARIESGKSPCVLLCLLDITERKQAEEKIVWVEKRYKSLIEKAPDGVALVGPDLGFTYVSPSARKIFGYGIEDALDITPNGSTHPDDLPLVIETLNRLIQDPSQTPTLQYRFRHKDGSWLWIESTFTNLFAEPSVEAIVINFRDVTGRLEAERKIQESEERSRLAHDAADLGTWQEDLLTQVFTLDERARRHYDQADEHPSVAEVAGRVHPEDAPRLQGAITSVFDSEADNRLEAEYRVIHRDGSVHWLQVHSRVHFEGRNGERVAVLAVGTSQDITERKAAEAELARRNRQLRVIHEATHRLNVSLDAGHIHEVIYANVRQLMPCDTLFISAFDPASGMISMAGGWHDGRPVDVTTYGPLRLEPQGSGIQSRVIRTQEPELIQDFQARLKNVQVVHHFDGDGQAVDELPEEGDIPRSALVVPLLAEGNVLGVIQVFSYLLNAYTEDDLQILTGFSAQAAIALSNARLYEHVRQENLERKRAEASLLVRTRQLASLFAIAERLGNTQSEEQALSVVIAEMESLLGAPANGIALMESDHRHFKIVRATDVVVMNLGRRFPIEEGLSGKVLREGVACFTADYAADPLRVEDLADVDTLGPGLFIPIRTESQFAGVLFALRRRDVDAQPFDQEDARLLNAVGEIMGSTLLRVRLFEQTNSQLNHSPYAVIA